MINYLLLLFPLTLIGISLWKCEYNNCDSFETVWSHKQAKSLQAITCIGVVLHHLTQSITNYGAINKGPITILSSMGILFTSIFFFFSGYGLITNVLEKPSYLDDFLKHRIPTVYIPFFIANIIYVLVRIFYSHIPTSTANILALTSGYLLINGNGWYIIEIIILYAFFYITFKIIKNKNIAIAVLCMFTLFIIYIGYISGHDYSSIGDRWFKGEWWYNSTIVFIMGILFARFKNQIIAFVKAHYRLIIILSLILFAISFYAEEKILVLYRYYNNSVSINKINGHLLTLISQMILCLLFTWLILIINLKINLHNCLLDFISSISMELFLVHGLFLHTLFDFTSVNHVFMYAIVISCSIIAAYILHFADSFILQILSHKKNNSYLELCERDLIRESKEKKKQLYKKIALYTFGLILTIFVACKIYNQSFKASLDYKKEIQTLQTASIGDVVYFGRYDTNDLTPGKEKLSWIVLKKDKDKLMLITEYGIDGSVYHQKHTEINWKNSDLHNLLNTAMDDSTFNKYEKNIIIPNPDSEDYVSLLSVDEAKELFTDDLSRQIDITDAAKNNGTNQNVKSKVNSWDMKGYRSSWWWLRGDDTPSLFAPIVTVDGEIVLDKKYVNKPSGAVRPVIWISISQANSTQ